MELIGIKSKIIKTGDDLVSVINQSLLSANQVLQNGDVLVISSKVVAVSQKRVHKLNESRDFPEELKELVRSEAEVVYPGPIVDFTLKYNIIIPNAGIDKSNAEPGTVILWPENPQQTVNEIRDLLIKEYALNTLGVLLVDSRCQPLRQGVSGVSIVYSGFIGVEDRRGEPDLYGRKLMITKQAKADELASAANLIMGEGNEAIPFVIARKAPLIFTDKKQDSLAEQFISPSECIFGSVFRY